jgi:hypothetical protein
MNCSEIEDIPELPSQRFAIFTASGNNLRFLNPHPGLSPLEEGA